MSSPPGSHNGVVGTHLTHDDGAINGQLQVLQSAPHHSDHTLHAVNLLPQEDVHGSNGSHLLQPGPHLMGDVVSWQLLQHLSSLPPYKALSRLSSPTGAVLGLDGQDGVQTGLGSVALVAAHGNRDQFKSLTFISR